MYEYNVVVFWERRMREKERERVSEGDRGEIKRW